MNTMNTTIYTRDEILEHRRLWLEALRSGDFQQTAGQLFSKTKNAYCCLGVACRIAGLPSYEVERDEELSVYFGVQGEEYNASSYLTLPTAGREWLGVSDENPAIDFPEDLLDLSSDFGDYIPRDVASLNDGGVTFAQIADLIEHFGFVDDEFNV